MHLSAGGRAVEVCGRGGYPTTAASYEIGMRLMDIGDFFNEDCTRRGGKGLSQVNPTPGNKNPRLSNIVEKAMGSIAKSGTAPIVEVLSPAERPTAHGMIFAATPASDIVCGPCQLASGRDPKPCPGSRSEPWICPWRRIPGSSRPMCCICTGCPSG